MIIRPRYIGLIAAPALLISLHVGSELLDQAHLFPVLAGFLFAGYYIFRIPFVFFPYGLTVELVMVVFWAAAGFVLGLLVEKKSAAKELRKSRPFND